MVAMVMKCAKGYQPAVIYIDECERIWPAKKKKSKKKKQQQKDYTNPNRIKKTIMSWKNKFITDETRITIVGCSSEPHNGSKKDFKKFFDRALYFPFPNYTTSRSMWKSFIEMAGGHVNRDFPLDILAQLSAGYSAGSIKKTCEFVLTPFRVTRLEERELKITEFIGPLSMCVNTMEEEYEEFKVFTDFMSGDGMRRKAIE